MHYILYKITNTINGKIYIGVHQTENLDDGYMGSGEGIKRAIKKYGKGAFEKTILQEFQTIEEMFDAESKIVNEDFVSRADTYNRKIGGYGGFEDWNKMYSTDIRKLAGKKWWESLSQEEKEAHKKRAGEAFKNSAAYKKRIKNWGRPMTEEGKKKISAYAKRRFQENPSINPMKGKIWITDGTKSQAIFPVDFQKWESLGFRKGRV